MSTGSCLALLLVVLIVLWIIDDDFWTFLAILPIAFAIVMGLGWLMYFITKVWLKI